MKSRLSNWREETDLLEAISGKMTEKEAEKKVSEKKINNKVIINPKLSEAVNEIGGEVISVDEGLIDTVKSFVGLAKNPKMRVKTQGSPMGQAVSGLQKRSAANAAAMKLLNQETELEGDSIDEVVGGSGTLVRQGVKYGGKRGGRAVQAGQKAAIAKGQAVKAGAAKGNVKKMIGTGRAEKAGALVGGVAGAIGGGILDGPVPVGDIVGGIVGSKVGGKIGRQIDKGGSALKKAVTKEAKETLGKKTRRVVGKTVKGGAKHLSATNFYNTAKEVGGDVKKVVGKTSRVIADIMGEAASYETVKKGEVLGALKRDNKGRKKPLSVKDRDKIADKVVKDKGDTSKSDDRYAYEEFEAAVEYFYAEGINEEGLDLIIEEIGLDNFVDFVDDSVELLTEERKARKMNVRTKAKLKKDVEAIKADKSDVVARSTPKDVLSRARTERAFKKPKLAKPAAKKEAPAPAPTKVKKTAAVVKKARKATVAKARKDFDGDGKVETPKAEHRGSRNKAITKAVAKAKPVQPKKPASKEGLRAKIKSAYEAGVKRHRKATQPVRVFHKGMKAGAKKTVKFAKDVKKAVVGEAQELPANIAAALSRLEKKRISKGGNPDDSPLPSMRKKKRVKKGDWIGPPPQKKVNEAKVDKGRSDYGKASIRNYRRSGPGHGEPAMFDPENKRGKLIDKRREEHKARRGVKGAKVPAYKVNEAKVDTGTAAEKASARNKRNTPAGKDYKFDTSVFITRKPGESLDSARTRKRRDAHAAKRGVKKEAFSNWRDELVLEGKCECEDCGQNPCVECGENHHNLDEAKVTRLGDAQQKAMQDAVLKRKEELAQQGKKKKREAMVEADDKAYHHVVGMLRKKYGKDAVLTKDSPKPKPPTEEQKKKNAAERKKRQDADNKAYAARAKKAGFKSTQDYTNVVARYGSEDNYKKGRGLGT